jgi:hypothetical protein
MLETILVVLLILWALGVFVVPTGGPLIHVLLVIVVVIVLLRLLRGERL